MKNFDENKIIAEALKKNEEIMKNYLYELQQGLSEQRLTIDKIKRLMINTISSVKNNAIEACSKMMSEESKKKLLQELAKDAERMKLSQQSTATPR